MWAAALGLLYKSSFALGAIWVWDPCSRHWDKIWILQSCVETFGGFGLPGSFFTRHHYLLA